MDTKNWFGEHAATIRLIALAGGIALAAIILLLLLQRFTTLEFVKHARLLFKTWSV